MKPSSAYRHTRSLLRTLGRLALATLADPALHLILLTAALVFLLGQEPWRAWDE